jgi:rhodanese-related sulfurtransferase
MRHLSVEGLAEFMRNHAYVRVLDVRLRHEHVAGHLQGDHHVPWYTPDWKADPDFLGKVLERLSLDDYVVVICSSGNLSCKAAELLEQAGFNHVYTVLGGYEDIMQARRAERIKGTRACLFESGGPEHEQD